MSGQTEGNGKDLASTVVSRDKTIVRTSIIGIIANVFLAGFKAVIGLFANSIAIVLDAVNNLSDALSSVITIIGTRLANKKPDKEHPLGHGRAEYLTAVVVAAIVLYAGITSLVESVKKIIHPETADYSTVGLIIIGAAIVVKLLLGQYVKKKGKEANSAALEASGSDALFDAILSASVLVSAIIFLPFLGLLYGGLQLIFDFKSPRWSPGLIIFILWLLCIIAAGILFAIGFWSTELNVV